MTKRVDSPDSVPAYQVTDRSAGLQTSVDRCWQRHFDRSPLELCSQRYLPHPHLAEIFRCQKQYRCITVVVNDSSHQRGRQVGFFNRVSSDKPFDMVLLESQTARSEEFIIQSNGWQTVPSPNHHSRHSEVRYNTRFTYQCKIDDCMEFQGWVLRKAPHTGLLITGTVTMLSVPSMSEIQSEGFPQRVSSPHLSKLVY